MNTLLRWLNGRSRGIAALEFALVAPVMLIILGGIVDYGLGFYDKALLNNGIAAGAEYAVLNASSLVSNGAAQQTAIETLVQNASGLSGVSVSPAPTGINPTTYSCVDSTASPPTLTSSSKGATCSNGAPAGVYVVITAQYTYTPLLSALSGMGSTTLTQSTTVQIQ